MRGKLTVIPEKQLIVMDRTFAKFYSDTMSEEYRHLQCVRADYPMFAVVRRRIKKNTHQEHYAGLTYAYMEEYICTHESKEQAEELLAQFKELKLISKCHSKSRRYPTIKKWFLGLYPAISEFGAEEKRDGDSEVSKGADNTNDAGYETVLQPIEAAA